MKPSKPKPAIKYGWLRAVLGFIAALLAMAIASSTGISIIASLKGIDMSQLMAQQEMIVQKLGIYAYALTSLLGLLATALILWIFRRFVDRRTFNSLGFAWQNYKKHFLEGIGLGFFLVAAGFIFLYILGMLTISNIQIEPLTLIGYLLMFIVVALNEEILMRGYFLNNMMTSMNKYIALLISSIIFAIIHMANANINLIAFFNIFLAGVVLGIYYAYTKNLWLPIGLHLAWNFFEGPVFGFEVSGLKTSSIIIHEIQGNTLLTGGEFGFEASLPATVLICLLIVVLHKKYRIEP
jgi:membrane protease YdiL (CAAX protease family)